jgi:hypothetical protein
LRYLLKYSLLYLLYLKDYFVHRDAVRELQTKCTELINESIINILELNETWQMQKQKGQITTKMMAIKNANKVPIGKMELVIKPRKKGKEVDHKLAHKMLAEKLLDINLNTNNIKTFLECPQESQNF